MGDQRKSLARTIENGLKQFDLVPQGYLTIRWPGRTLARAERVSGQYVKVGRKRVHEPPPLARRAGIGVQTDHSGPGPNLAKERSDL
jgi:hypothetical protein